MPPPNIRVRGVRQSIPAGYVLGRVTSGTGDVELLDILTLGTALAATGVLSTPGSVTGLSPIANNRVLANVSGATANPSATALTAPAAGLTITGGSSAFAFAFANDLAALEALASTGVAVRTGSDAWAQRTITGTADKITVTNGDGVSGNPTLTISATYAGQNTIVTLGTIATGTWQATKIGLAYGGTNADLSATGGTSQVLKQASAGAAVTVGQLATTDLSDYDEATFWEILDTAAGSDFGDLSDQVFLPNVDFGDLTGCGNTLTASFTQMDFGVV